MKRRVEQKRRSAGAAGRTISAVCFLLIFLANGCRQTRPGDEASGPAKPSAWPGFASGTGPIMAGRPIKLGDLTESERRFGVAPKRGPGVVYQDDIILMEHGDQAIRSFSSNGLSWTFDANAPQVNEIQPGKIVFATGRAVGRVLALERHGDQVSAILGPVQLTDLVKSGKFAYNQPLDLNSAIAFVAPDYPGAANSSLMQSSTPGAQSSIRSGSGSPGWHVAQYYVVSDTGKWTPMRTVTGSWGRSGKPTLLRTNFHPSTQRRAWAIQAGTVPTVPSNIPGVSIPIPVPTLPAPSVPSPGNLGNFIPAPIPFPYPSLPMIPFNGLQATPCANCGGLGVKLYEERNGLRVWISVVFHLDHPKVLFYANIQNGGIVANLQLVGGAGVTVTLDAASSPQFQGNINQIGLIPLDITVPIGGLLVPLQICLSQSIDLQSAFSAKTSTLHGEGGIGLTGEIMADYDNGWNITAPHGEVKQNLAGMVSGISVGINSMVFAVNQRLMVGVGAFSFAAGPYVDLISSITSLKGSSIATTLLSRTPICAQGTFNMSLGAGIGYSMPRVVANVINTVLGWFGVKPIKSSGSIIAIPKRKTLIDHRDEIPNGCSG
jgi:hypothetical protein